MSGRDYYEVLGVSRAASARSIRDAYRDLVKKMHPDQVGSGATKSFQAVVEAYETLSDASRRRAYNHELDLRRTSGEAILGAGAEPLVFEGISLRRLRPYTHPTFESLLEHLLRNVTGVPKGGRMEGLNLEVVLSPREALRGGVLPVAVPVFHRCPACGGSGCAWSYPCTRCGQQGVVESDGRVAIRIPAPVRHGTIIEVPLRRLGIENLHLRLHLSVEPARV